MFLRPLTDVKKANEATDESDRSRIVLHGDNLSFDSKENKNEYKELPKNGSFFFQNVKIISS